MGIINGIFSFIDSDRTQDISQYLHNIDVKMLSSPDNKTDKFEHIQGECFYFSCHHQFLTPESHSEQLPYHDKEAGLIMNAAAILDNREELFNKLSISSNEQMNISDAHLLFLSYKKWGIDCVLHLLGDFVFIIADEKQKKVFVCRDHAGRMPLYYRFHDGYFAFSSLMRPLAGLPGTKKDLCEEWLAEFLSNPTVTSKLSDHLTPFEGVNQIKPNHYLIIDGDGIKETCYWDMHKIKPVKLKTDDEYNEAFKEIFNKSVKCKLRSSGEVGVLLSGGLDSSALACVAADMLSKEGKNLRTYTSVPIDKYEPESHPYRVYNEKPLVLEMKEKYPNMINEFCASEGYDSFNSIEELLEILEEPYKGSENAYWLNNMCRKASSDGCKIVLNGQYGNESISFGDPVLCINTLFSEGKFIRFAKELDKICKKRQISRKKFVKYFINSHLQFIVNKGIIEQNTSKMYGSSFSLISKSLSEQYKIPNRLSESGLGNQYLRNHTIHSYRYYNIKSTTFTQVAGFESKISNRYGIIQRDPTKDKRIIEFCYGLPVEQLLKDGVDRLPVRRAMEGIVPDSIRLNMTWLGIQSCDWLDRMTPNWSKYHSLINGKLSSQNLSRYFNLDEMREYFTKCIDLDSQDINDLDIRLYLAYYIFTKFYEIEFSL